MQECAHIHAQIKRDRGEGHVKYEKEQKQNEMKTKQDNNAEENTESHAKKINEEISRQIYGKQGRSSTKLSFVRKNF